MKSYFASPIRSLRSNYQLSGHITYHRYMRMAGLCALFIVFATYLLSGYQDAYQSTDHIARVDIGQAAGGNEDWLRDLNLALTNPRAKAVVLVIDQAVSSGGDLYPVEQAISQIRRSKSQLGKDGNAKVRPIVSFIYGYALGGSYVLASQTDFIVAQKTATLGGLSVSVSSFDPKPLLTRIGVDIITKGFGDLKVQPDPKDKNYTAYMRHRTSVYESLYRWMVATVQQNRSLSKSDLAMVSRGEWYLGDRAKQYGLCDATGDFTLTVEKVRSADPMLENLVVLDYSHSDSLGFAVNPSASGLKKSMYRGYQWFFRMCANEFVQSVTSELARAIRLYS